MKERKINSALGWGEKKKHMNKLHNPKNKEKKQNRVPQKPTNHTQKPKGPKKPREQADSQRQTILTFRGSSRQKGK